MCQRHDENSVDTWVEISATERPEHIHKTPITIYIIIRVVFQIHREMRMLWNTYC